MLSTLINPILEAVNQYKVASALLAILGFVAFMGALWRLLFQ